MARWSLAAAGEATELIIGQAGEAVFLDLNGATIGTGVLNARVLAELARACRLQEQDQQLVSLYSVITSVPTCSPRLNISRSRLMPSTAGRSASCSSRSYASSGSRARSRVPRRVGFRVKSLTRTTTGWFPSGLSRSPKKETRAGGRGFEDGAPGVVAQGRVGWGRRFSAGRRARAGAGADGD